MTADALMRARLEQSRVARMATIDEGGRPHLVPLVYAFEMDRIVSAVDHKPKATTDLKRLRNIAANPKTSLLVDHYDDDWSQLWWIRADGLAQIIETGPEWEAAVDLLAAKYPQYRSHAPTGAVIELTIEKLSGWSAT